MGGGIGGQAVNGGAVWGGGVTVHSDIQTVRCAVHY